MLVQNGENLAQKVLVSAARFAVKNDWSDDDELVVDLL
jgi:hypothetical protein